MKISHSFLSRPALQLPLYVAILLITAFAHAQTTYQFSTTTTSTSWLNSNNWTGGTTGKYPGNAGGSPAGEGTDTDIASFGTLAANLGGTNAVSATIGINMNTGTGSGVGNNGQANGSLSLGAINVLSGVSKNLTISNSSSAAGILHLNGATLNGKANTILINQSTTGKALTVTNGSGTMDLGLGNATENVIQITGDGNITIGSRIVNGAGSKLVIDSSGAGITILSGANTYDGGTTVRAGTLQLSGAGTLGSTSATLEVAGGTLNLNGTSQTVGVLSGSGGNIRNNHATTASVLTIGQGNATGGTYAGVIGSGTGAGTSLIKTGSGLQTLTGTNTYTGTTQVNAGTLLVNGNQTSATGLTTVTNSGSVLGGMGIVGGGVALSTNGTLRAGTGDTATNVGLFGTLTVNGLSGVDAGPGILQFALGPNGANSTLHIASGAFISSGTQRVSFINAGASTAPGTTYTGIITGLSSNPGTLSNWVVSNPELQGTFSYREGIGGDYAVLADGMEHQWIQSSHGEVDFTVVPEPSTYLAGAFALLAIGYAQRRRLTGLLARKLVPSAA